MSGFWDYVDKSKVNTKKKKTNETNTNDSQESDFWKYVDESKVQSSNGVNNGVVDIAPVFDSVSSRMTASLPRSPGAFEYDKATEKSVSEAILDRTKVTALSKDDQKNLSTYIPMLANKKYSRGNWSVLKEVQLVSSMEEGEAKEKRKKELLKELKSVISDHNWNTWKQPLDDGWDQGDIASMLMVGVEKLFEGDNFNENDLYSLLSGETRDADFWDLTVNSAKRGYTNSIYGEESFAAMNGEANEKAYYENKLKGREYQFTPDNWFENAISGASELLGQQVRQWTNPDSLALGTSAAGMAALAGQAGPQALVPEEIISVPGAFFTGIHAGSVKQNLEIEAGHAYNEMLEAGVSEDTAKKIAWAVGSGNAALEAVQLDELTKAYKAVTASGATKTFWKRVLGELADRGVDVAKETAQEVLQEGVTIAGVQAGSKIDTGEWAYSADEVGNRLGETALSSALSFGFMNTPAAGRNIASITADHKAQNTLTANEQAVVDKIYQDRLEKAAKVEPKKNDKPTVYESVEAYETAQQETTRKLSATEKKQIYNEVINDLEKGYITTDEIESVLGGENYEAYKKLTDEESSLVEQQKALYDEYKELGKKENPNLEEQSRYHELKVELTDLQQKIDSSRNNPERAALKAQLDKDTYEMVKGDKLVESFFEDVRSKRQYQNDATKYEGKARDVIQQVIDSGLADDSNKSHEFWDFAAQLASDRDMDVTLASNEQILEMAKADWEAAGKKWDSKKFDGKTMDAYVNKGKIVINAKTKRAMNVLLGHEITHTLEKSGHYKRMQKILLEYAEAMGELESRRKDRAGTHDTVFENAPKIKEMIDMEVTADLAGDYFFTNKDFIQHLLTKDKNIFQKAWDEVKYLAKMATGSEQKRLLERAKRAYAKAWKDSAKATEMKLSLADSDNLLPAQAQVLNIMASNIATEARKRSISLEQYYAATSGINAFNPTKADAREIATALEPVVKQLGNENYYGYLEKMRSYYESDVVRYSDSDGKQLTKEQQDYFKDSKMRDENGNLKVMYHGSQDAGFHVFDAKMSDDDTSFFFVDRNDVAASYSGTTETYEAKTIRTAEDMNNFLAEIGYDHYEAVEQNGKYVLLENGDHVATKDTAQELYEEFCWYEGVGEGDANYKVYLNLTNPLEVDAKGKNWNNISREYSQEVADRYHSLTAEEKAALHDLTEWGEYGIFKDEMLEARAAGNSILANAYEKLGGANANLYDAFSIASENFSNEAISQFAAKQMNTRDYAKKAKAEGYDGVIFKNIVDIGGYGGEYTPSTVAIAFDSNQIKSVANAKPTGDADIRFSLSNAETDKNYLDAVNNGDTETARKIMEAVAKRRGYTIRAYHGTSRGDRVGNVFLPERATSGPMAFFTDNKGIAENYAKSKQDTSMAYDPDYDSYETQFRIKVLDKDIPLYRAWGFLTFDARRRITQKAGQLRENWDGDNELILDPETNEANGGFQWQLKEARGNAIQALTEQWLNSGTLFNEEGRFLDVLEMAGVTEEFKKVKGMGDLYFKDPSARHEKVYDAFLKIKNPFVTANVDEQFIADLEAWYEVQDQSKYVRESMESDLWDKNSIDAYDFAERLRRDLENDTTHAWTSIPDSVTDYLKRLGYDGIKDMGGKFTLEGHTVWIPFTSSQIKSAETVTYDDAGNVIPITERFDKKDVDIRHSISNKGDTPKEYGRWNVYAKDIMLDKSGEAPLRTDFSEELVEPLPDDLAPVQKELDTLYARVEEMEAEALKAIQNQDADALDAIGAESEEILQRIREIEEDEQDRIGSIAETEAPPEMEAPYVEHEAVNLTKKATADIVREVRKSLALTNNQVAAAKDIIEQFRTGKIVGRENLIDELQRNFGKYTEKGRDEDLAEIQSLLKSTPVNVESYIKGGIADYQKVMRSNFGKIRFSKKGSAVDQVYAELSDLYPDMFPAEIYVPEDQLLRMIEVANMDANTETVRDIDIGAIEEAADAIINGLRDFRRNEDLNLSERESKAAFQDLLRNADQYAPEEVAPVAETPKPAKKIVEAPIKKDIKNPNPKVAKVLTEEAKVEKEKSGIGSKLVSALVDKGMVFENLSLEKNNPELQAKYNYALPSKTEARAQYLMENGDGNVKSLKDIMKTAEKTGKANEFCDYLYHVHNIDRMTLDTRFGIENKTVFGETVTADVSRKKAANYEKANPQFKAMAQDVYAYNKYLRQLLVDNGVISQETADLWEKMYPHYVPVRRVDQNGVNVTVPLDTNKTGVNAPVKRAIGGSSDIQPLFNTMAQRTEQTYRAIARNSFGIELKNTLGAATNTQQTSVDEVIDSVVDQDELLKAGTMTSNPTFTVFENGERVEFEITEDMFDALKPAGKLLGYRNKALTKVSDARRNLLTVWNPVFALYRNPIKDIQDVAVNSQHALKTYANVPNAIYQLATGGNYANEYHKAGGKSNTYFDSKTNKFKKEDNFFKKVFGLPIRAIETAGEFIEEIPRLAEYIASRKQGRSVERSMLDAARVTTNFAAGGDFTKFLNSHGFTFLNASVQGASQHVRNFREAKQQGLKGYVKVLAKYTIAGLPGILLNSMLWDDDEDYEELSDYVKQNYYVVAKTQDGKFVRIPKGRTAAVMQNLFEQMEHLVTGDDEADFGTFYELFMNNIAPNNPLENNILAPIIQAANNEAWYGGELVPSRLQDLPAEEQFDESTDSISKWLGENFDPFGLGAYRINYLLDQYSGGLGDVFLPMLTPEAESGDDSFMGNFLAPWKKELTTDSVLNNKNPGDFYDLRDELEVNANAKNATEEDMMKAMYMDSVSWEMSALYKQKREVQNSDLSDSEKYEQVRELQEQINELAKNAMGGYNNVSINGLYSEVGDKRYNKDAETGKWYEIKPKNADGSDNWYYQMEQKVTKGLGISYGEYWNNREEYNFAYEKPERYTVAKAVGGFEAFKSYTDDLYDIKADKDENGKSISGSRKAKVIDYINNMDADYGTKIILFKMEYNADDTYNEDIIDYLNSRDDISYKEMETILKYLGFEVDSEGRITW